MHFLLGYLPNIVCAWHAWRTGRAQPWLWILVIAPGVGALFYVAVVLLPEWMGGRTARRVGTAAVKILDPEREYRAAALALEDVPSVQNHLRVGHAAFALGRFDEAEIRFREATAGSHADDADLIVHHAHALVELNRAEDALARLEDVRKLDAKLIERADVALLFARAFEALGRNDEADQPYRWAADRLPGLEAAARYCAFLANTGRTEDARLALTEIERRFAKIAGPLRPEAKPWRDMAAVAVTGAPNQ